MRDGNSANKQTAYGWLSDAVASRDRSTCWLDWPYDARGSSDSRPKLTHEGRSFPASHVVLTLDGRPRPPAPLDKALHSCDLGDCLNPDHLRWGSQQDNVADRHQRGRSASGERCGAARLTLEDVRAIRARYVRGNGRALATEFGVSQPAISAIIVGKTWRAHA